MSKAVAKPAADVERGQRIYTPLVLREYDLFVLEFSNRFAWQCPSVTMLERYKRHIGRRHLDLGVGTEQPANLSVVTGSTSCWAMR